MAPPLTAGRALPLLAVFLLFQAVILLLPGHLAINGHEVDVLHSADIALRMADGQVPHRDFMTPLGILSTEPVALFLGLGFSLGTAFIAANLAIAILFLPLIARLVPRFGPAGMAFGALTLILLTALVYGGTAGTVSMSMYYNRWGWAAMFVIMTILFFPDPEERDGDAISLGLCLAFLALLKATFFAAAAPVVALTLLIDRSWRMMIVTGLVGLGAAAATTLWRGIGFWGDYLGDLQHVAQSEVRPQPGIDFAFVLSAPNYLPGTLVLLLSVMLLRSMGRKRDGLVLLLLAPAVGYITYQNWGNDPKWLIFLGFAALVWSMKVKGGRIFGYRGRTAFAALAAAAFAISGPTLINLTISPVRNAFADPARFMPMLADPAHDTLLIERSRSFAARSSIINRAIHDPRDTPEEAFEVAGVSIEPCSLINGYVGSIHAMAALLEADGMAGKRLALIDVANPLPQIGPFRRLADTPPWYYGGTGALAEAEYVVVPRCPVGIKSRAPYLDAIAPLSAGWTLVSDTHLYWLFRV